MARGEGHISQQQLFIVNSQRRPRNTRQTTMLILRELFCFLLLLHYDDGQGGMGGMGWYGVGWVWGGLSGQMGIKEWVGRTGWKGQGWVALVELG